MVGDGRVLIRAIERGASLAVGWELSHDVFCLGMEHIERAGQLLQWPSEVRSRISLQHGDAREAQPLDFDVTTLFLLPEGLAILGPWLQQVWSTAGSQDMSHTAEGQGGYHRGRVVSQGWPLFPPGLKTSPCRHSTRYSTTDVIGRSLQLVRQRSIPLTGTSVYLYE